MATFRDYIPTLARIPWMAQGAGKKLFDGLALWTDEHLEGVRLAIRVRFLDEAPADALGYAGSDSNIERYPPDTDDTYRARLQARWTTWPFAGTEQGLEQQLAEFGITAEVYEVWEWGTLYPDYWSQFWVLITDFPYAIGAEPKWGSVTWGSFAWGSGVDIDVANALRAIIRKWKPAHMICREIVILISGHYWGEPGLVWGGFNWGGVQHRISGV